MMISGLIPGRLIPEKGINELLDAARQLRNRPNIKFACRRWPFDEHARKTITLETLHLENYH